MNILLSKKMRYFICLMETRCINVAAEKLCITRSPLGKILTELEDFIGNPLFERKYNILKPTTVALNLYDKIKPLHDLICAIEDEFHHKPALNKYDLIFDSCVPTSSVKYLTHKLKINKVPVNCSVINPYDKFSRYSIQKNMMFFTNKKIHDSESLREISLGEDAVILMVPEDECCDNGINYNDRSISLLVRVNDVSNSCIETIASILKKKLPNIKVDRCDTELPELMLQAHSSKAIIMLPECLSSFIEYTQLRKIKLKDVMVDKKLYVRKDFNNENIINQVIHQLSVI